MTTTIMTERTITEENGRFIVKEGNKVIASCKTLAGAERMRDQKAREIAKVEAERREYARIDQMNDDISFELWERQQKGMEPVQYIYKGVYSPSHWHGTIVFADGFRCKASF